MIALQRDNFDYLNRTTTKIQKWEKQNAINQIPLARKKKRQDAAQDSLKHYYGELETEQFP